LVPVRRITTNEANLCFYKGIPSSLRKKIKQKIPESHQMVTAAPSIDSVLGYLRDKFDMDDTDFFSDADSNLDLSDINDDLEPPIKRSRTLKKKALRTLEIHTLIHPS
jgi:hypothetical protein